MGDDIIIQVKDYAGGIPKTIIENIFEPYFTTKSDEKGTGLGLYMCKSILNKVNAEINVENFSETFDDKEYFGANFKIIIQNYKG